MQQFETYDGFLGSFGRSTLVTISPVTVTAKLQGLELIVSSFSCARRGNPPGRHPASRSRYRPDGRRRTAATARQAARAARGWRACGSPAGPRLLPRPGDRCSRCGPVRRPRTTPGCRLVPLGLGDCVPDLVVIPIASSVSSVAASGIATLEQRRVEDRLLGLGMGFQPPGQRLPDRGELPGVRRRRGERTAGGTIRGRP